jgi:tRNA threonylcarbamoyladenosine biosynthesis protein TsaE
VKIIHITSQGELSEVAAAILNELGERTVIAFRGEMGAGKTTLISEIASQLGVKDTVTSPTFALINQYKGCKKIYHFDFYRINNISEAFDLGYEEYFYSGDLCLIEWPERIESLLPENTMTVHIAIDNETSRTFSFSPNNEVKSCQTPK